MPVDIPTITDEHDAVIRLVGPLDDLGRRQFFAFWRDNNRVRGQVFHADPDEFANRRREQGKTVHVENCADQHVAPA